jgi:hypothetical protein
MCTHQQAAMPEDLLPPLLSGETETEEDQEHEQDTDLVALKASSERLRRAADRLIRESGERAGLFTMPEPRTPPRPDDQRAHHQEQNPGQTPGMRP